MSLMRLVSAVLLARTLGATLAGTAILSTGYMLLWYGPAATLELWYLILPALLFAVAQLRASGQEIRVFSHARRTARRLDAITSPSPQSVADLIAKAPAGPTRSEILESVRILPADAPFAATYGLVRPQVVMTQGLVDQCTDSELLAVYHHERSHQVMRDPLRLLLLGMWAGRWAIVPGLTEYARRVTDECELRADRASIEAAGRASLASALLKVTGSASAPDPGMCGFGGEGALHERIRQMEGYTDAPPPNMSDMKRNLGAAIALLIGAIACVLLGLHDPT